LLVVELLVNCCNLILSLNLYTIIFSSWENQSRMQSISCTPIKVGMH
jgi:hypothetical protein